MQVVINGNEVRELPVVAPFGQATNPPKNSQAIILSFAGDRQSGGLIIGVHNIQGRPDLEQGESAIHNEAGDKIHIKQDGSIEVIASKSVTVTTKTALINADKIELGGKDGKPVITEDTICPFTGLNHFGGIPVVTVQKSK